MKAVLTEARDMEAKEDYFYEHAAAPIPEFQQRLQVPRIPGVNASMFEHWPERLEAARKVPHVECDAEKADQFWSLVEVAKKHGIVKRYWGSGVHLSSYDGEAKTSGLQRKALLKFSGKHVEIQASYEHDALVDITQLDSPVAIRSVDGIMVGHPTLRHLLYTHYKI